MILHLTRNDLVSYLDTLKLKGNGIEIGVQKGDFSEIILNNWKGCGKLYLMDAWKHQDENIYVDKANVDDEQQSILMKSVIDRFQKKANKVGIIQDFTPAGAKRFPDNYFNFIYIDADHSYVAVKNDLEAWWPKLKDGGIFAGHDYNMDGMWNGEFGIIGEFGVTKAVKEFFKNTIYPINHTFEQVCQSWWVIK